MNRILSICGRVIYSLAIAFFAVGHLTKASTMSTMVPSPLAPVATPLIYFTGLCLLLAAISIIIDRYARIAGILLAVFLILIVLMVQLPMLPDQTVMTMMIMTIAMAGGALYIAAHSRNHIEHL